MMFSQSANIGATRGLVVWLCSLTCLGRGSVSESEGVMARIDIHIFTRGLLFGGKKVKAEASWPCVAKCVTFHSRRRQGQVNCSEPTRGKSPQPVIHSISRRWLGLAPGERKLFHLLLYCTQKTSGVSAESPRTCAER